MANHVSAGSAPAKLIAGRQPVCEATFKEIELKFR
jgi:hypothetical protein